MGQMPPILVSICRAPMHGRAVETARGGSVPSYALGSLQLAALVTPDYHCMKDTEQEPLMGSFSYRVQDVISHRFSSKV